MKKNIILFVLIFAFVSAYASEPEKTAGTIEFERMLMKVAKDNLAEADRDKKSKIDGKEKARLSAEKIKQEIEEEKLKQKKDYAKLKKMENSAKRSEKRYIAQSKKNARKVIKKLKTIFIPRQDIEAIIKIGDEKYYYIDPIKLDEQLKTRLINGFLEDTILSKKYGQQSATDSFTNEGVLYKDKQGGASLPGNETSKPQWIFMEGVQSRGFMPKAVSGGLILTRVD